MRDPKISLDEVRRVARLARLSMGEDEARDVQQRLDAILDYMAELDALDVSDVPPTFHAVPIVAALRDDAPVPSLDREVVLEAAPAHDAGGFSVPVVLEVDE